MEPGIEINLLVFKTAKAPKGLYAVKVKLL